ncbi:MAG: penicillin-binding protein 2 [Sporomusaceae bacterium]|nr:penicillin-binding protein 2 [Sporomusaceae bacterium]
MAIIAKRLRKITILLGILVGLLMLRLGYLQLYEGKSLALAGLHGRVQEISAETKRGDFFDRHHEKLTNSTVAYELFLFPAEMPDQQTIREKLTGIIPEQAVAVILRLALAKQPLRSHIFVSEATSQFLNKECPIPGLIAVRVPLRYESNQPAAHVIGYVDQTNHGITGLEARYDLLLTSSEERYVAAMLDGEENLIPGLGYKEVNGGEAKASEIVLTLDKNLQRKLEALADQRMKRGALIVMEAKTGEILALVSRPNFSPAQVARSFQEPYSPLVNRAITAYQPGSVFKLVVAAAALDLGIVTPETVFYDAGYIDVDKLRFFGWDYKQGPRGKISFQDALAFSSNPVFIEVGQKIGATKLLAYADKLGFGHKTSLSLPDEDAGHLPPVDQVFPGDLANLSIGQGSCEVTPLQLASLVGTIVNDGVLVEPKLVAERSADSSKQLLQVLTARQLREMMAAVTSYGTGQEAAISGYGAAGKTGSAETGRADSGGKGINHAWFAGYTPRDNPQYVIVVFVEEGHSGGEVAAPLFGAVAREVMQQK